MDFYELINELREIDEIEGAVMAHNFNGNSGFEIDKEVQACLIAAAREEFGDTIELYHGTEEVLNTSIEWRDNSSFTDEFDIEFAGEDGYIVVAQVPVERIKFYLEEENEFVLSEGALNCEVYRVKEYFDL